MTRPDALVFLHGFMGSAADWDSVLAHCPAIPVLALDLPGHGSHRISAPNALTFDTVTVWLDHAITAFGSKHPMVIGYSMGARLALHWALNTALVAQSLIIESGSPGLQTEKARQERQVADADLARKLRTQPFEEFISQWFDQPLFTGIKQLPGYSELVGRRSAADPLQLALAVTQLGTGKQPDLWPKLKELPCPTVLITGKNDTRYVRFLQQMAPLIPHANLDIVPHHSHNVHIQSPDRLAQWIHQLSRLIQGQSL